MAVRLLRSALAALHLSARLPNRPLAAELRASGAIPTLLEEALPSCRALIVSTLLLGAYPRLGWAQAALHSELPEALPALALLAEPITPPTHFSFSRNSAVSHPRATLIGASAGAVLGGLGTAAWILNALAPNCVTAVASTSSGPTVTSSHCQHRSRIVVLETVTIAVGVTAGGFGGAWVARRIADWRDGRHRDRLPSGR